MNEITGMLLRKITDDIEEVRRGTLNPTDRKAFFFSAHELNVVAFARVLGLSEPELPDYGSTFIIETLKNESNDYFIRVRSSLKIFSKLKLKFSFFL